MVDALASGASAFYRRGSSSLLLGTTHGNAKVTSFMTNKKITLHVGDLPDGIVFKDSVAVDTETMGLCVHRDPLCTVQLSAGDGSAHVVKLNRDSYQAPNLKSLLADSGITKIFHYARFDLAVLSYYMDVHISALYCTKIASRLARTYSSKHGLKELCKELISVDISKQQQSSDWGHSDLSQAQLNYAACDVLYLHRLKERLDAMLVREKRQDLATACFTFLPTRVALDMKGWQEEDIFAHQ